MIFYQFLDRGWDECPDPDAVFFEDRSDDVFQGVTETSYYAHRVFVDVVLSETSVDKSLEIILDQLLDIWVIIM